MRKRSIPILAMVLILTLLLPVISASALIGPQYVSTSNGKGLYLREGPSREDDILCTIPYGAMLDSCEYYNGTWVAASYNGYYGYCMSRYLSSSKPGSRPDPTPSGGGTTNLYKDFHPINYYVTVRPSTPSGYVNLRWAPSKSAPIQTTCYAGTQLHVVSENGTWAQVINESNDVCGFMMLSFLSTIAVGDGISNS